MHIQIVNFKLHEMTRADYDALLEQAAPQFPQIPGLKSKHYLADDEANVYGGVYVWESKQAMLDYQAGEIYQGILAHPGLADVSSVDFDVIEDHSFGGN
ncbi:MAG: YdhR family protein [Mariniblastus sp.]|nr:YdhR family protein [Mariniblastus sp.]